MTGAERKVSNEGFSTDSDAGLRLPESVQGIIAARLDALPIEEKLLLQDAAVVGKVFWPAAVAAIGGRTEEEVAAGLAELVRRSVVRTSRRSSVAGQAEHGVRHGQDHESEQE